MMMIRDKSFNSTTPTIVIVVVTGVVVMIAATSIFSITTTNFFAGIRSIKDTDDRKKKQKKNKKKKSQRQNHRMNDDDQDDYDSDSDDEGENDHHYGSIDNDNKDNHNDNNYDDYQQDENNNKKNAYEQLIGNTPFILLNNLSKLINRNIYVKMECYNPSGTGKDRAAYHMIHIAEITNQLPQPIPIIQMTIKQQQTATLPTPISSRSSLPTTLSTSITNGHHHIMESINDEQNDDNHEQQQTQPESIQNETNSDNIDSSPIINSGTSIVSSSKNEDIITNYQNNNNDKIKQTKQQRQQLQQKQKMEDNLIIYHQLIHDAMTLSRTGGLVIEGSSGSTGIAVANQCYYKGHGCIIILPDDQSYEKANIISQLFHAIIYIVPTSSISNPYHYLNISKRIYQIASSISGIKAVFLNQFENLANYYIHYEQTGPEIYQQFHYEMMKKKNKKNIMNDQFDAFVMSAGTGGTISGIGQYLKERIPNVQIILVDPPGSILYNKIIYNVGYTIQQSERDLKRHRYDTIVEGIGLDRITANIAIGLKEDNDDEEDFEMDQEEDCKKKCSQRIIDTAIQVTDQDCIDMAHYILQLEGILIGSSSSMNIVGAIEAAGMLPCNSNIVTIICDTGYRHISRFYNPTFIQSKDLIWPTTSISSPITPTPIATSTISSTTPSSSTTNDISEIPQQPKQQDQNSSSSHHDDSVLSPPSSTIRIPRCIQAILMKEQTNKI